VIEGPRHLRSLRSRQLISIEQQLVAAQREQAELGSKLQNQSLSAPWSSDPV
jgi:hypothetical protein